jgi:hypothetical protein
MKTEYENVRFVEQEYKSSSKRWWTCWSKILKNNIGAVEFAPKPYAEFCFRTSQPISFSESRDITAFLEELNGEHS